MNVIIHNPNTNALMKVFTEGGCKKFKEAITEFKKCRFIVLRHCGPAGKEFIFYNLYYYVIVNY